VSAPSGLNSSPQNQWAALRAAHELTLKKPSWCGFTTTLEPILSKIPKKSNTRR